MPASGSLLSLALAHSPPGGLCARGRSSQHRHPPRTPGQGSLQAAKDFQTGQFPSNLLSVLPKRHCGSRPPGRAVSSAVGKTQGSLGTGSPRGTQLPKPPPRVACDITETYSKETRTAVLSDSGEEKPPATCSIQIRRDLQDVGRSRGRGQGRWGTAPHPAPPGPGTPASAAGRADFIASLGRPGAHPTPPPSLPLPRARKKRAGVGVERRLRPCPEFTSVLPGAGAGSFALGLD